MSAISEAAQQRATLMKSNLAKRHLAEKIAFGVLWLAGAVVIVVLFFVIFYLLIQGLKFFNGPENLMEDAVMVESNEEILEAVASNANAIGYLSFGYLDEQTKALTLNGVAPTADNVRDGSYPVVRNLYLLTPADPPAHVRAWLDFIRSDRGQAIVEQAGYIPLETLQAWQPAGESFAAEVSVSGSTTVQPLAEKLGVAFQELYPGTAFIVEGGGSTSGIKDAGKGNVDVGMSSRDIKDHEFHRYEEMRAYAIARDGIALVVNPLLPVDTLTINQVRDIFTGHIANWADLGGPDQPITVVSRESDSGTWDGFEKWILGKNLLIDHGMETGNLKLVLQQVGATLRFSGRFLTEEPLPGMGGEGGISTTIITTIYLVLLTLLIATPMGVGAAIYLVEYAGEMGSQSNAMRRMVEVIRFAVETLAGVPSIIYGLFGFALFVTWMHLGLSLLSGALAGACLILPTLIRTTEESLLTVPRSFREGSLALGATKWQTIFQVVLPAAIPGIVTGVILGVGRIVSETAVFYVTLGGSINLPGSIMDQGRTMVLHLYSLMMDANAPEPAMGTAVIVVITVILINLAINYFSKRLSRSMSGRA